MFVMGIIIHYGGWEMNKQLWLVSLLSLCQINDWLQLQVTLLPICDGCHHWRISLAFLCCDGLYVLAAQVHARASISLFAHVDSTRCGLLRHHHMYPINQISVQFKPLVWVGMNTFFFYLIAASGYSDVIISWFYYNDQSGNSTNNLMVLSYNHIFCLDSTSPPVR